MSVIPFPSGICDRADIMGRHGQGQRQLSCEFRLDEAVPEDHLVQKLGALLDDSWVYMELAPY
jgi:hypothetical protein